jgi:hypothetical protein
MAKTDGFPLSLLTKLNTAILNKTKSPHIPNTHNTTQKMYATFILHSSLTRKMTNLFHNTNLKIAFRSTNTFRNVTYMD